MDLLVISKDESILLCVLSQEMIPVDRSDFTKTDFLYIISLYSTISLISLNPLLVLVRRPLVQQLHKSHKRQGNFHSYIRVYLDILENNTVSASGCRKSDDELSMMDQEYLPMDDALQPLQPLQPLLPLPRHSPGPALWSYLADRPANLLLARRKPDSDTLELAYDYE